MSPRRRGHRHGPGHPAEANGTAAGLLAGSATIEPAEAPETEESAPQAPAPRAEPNAAAVPGRTRSRGGPERGPERGPAERRAPRSVPEAAEAALEPDEEGGDRKPACTLAQMRRFIKSRPYVPVHELRRRFEINGIEDEVSPVPTDKGTLFVGLPALEAAYLSELIKSGDVGCELLLDPTSPAVIGVFPMRPVARQ